MTRVLGGAAWCCSVLAMVCLVLGVLAAPVGVVAADEDGGGGLTVFCGPVSTQGICSGVCTTPPFCPLGPTLGLCVCQP